MMAHTHGGSTRQASYDSSAPATRLLRTVALVGRYAHQHLHDTMRRVDYDVVFIESTAHAYSKIKRVLPDLVIVCLSPADMDGCQILSMLALDSDTSRIPVLTCSTPSDDVSRDDADGFAHAFGDFGPSGLN